MAGKVVRLKQGQFDKRTDYSDDPLAVAQHWKSQEAQWLHIVDLDGAKTGEMKNIDVIKKNGQEVVFQSRLAAVSGELIGSKN